MKNNTIPKLEKLSGITLLLQNDQTITGYVSPVRIDNDCIPKGWHKYSVKFAFYDEENTYEQIAKFALSERLFDVLTKTPIKELEVIDEDYCSVMDIMSWGINDNDTKGFNHNIWQKYD